MENGNTKENIRQETVLVETGKSRRVEYPDIAFAQYIERQNLGIAILNKRKMISYVANFKSPIHDMVNAYDQNLWKELIDQSLEEAENPSDLEVMLVGNPPPPKEERDFWRNSPIAITKEDSKWIDFNNNIVKYLSEKGVKDIKNHLYNEDLFHNYSLKVDTLKCQISLEIGEPYEGKNPFLLDPGLGLNNFKK